MKMLRRKFLKSVLVGFGNLGWFGRTGRLWALAQTGQNRGAMASGCVFFNVDQARTLEAMLDQIVPPDDLPGARAAGTMHYIDRALALWEPESRWDYVAGLEGVDESSELLFKGKFANLKPEQQVQVLQALEKGDAPGRVWRNFQVGRGPSGPYPGGEAAGSTMQRFFELVVRHTMQGYYGHPKYGGNRDGASWKMLKYVGARHL